MNKRVLVPLSAALAFLAVSAFAQNSVPGLEFSSLPDLPPGTVASAARNAGVITLVNKAAAGGYATAGEKAASYLIYPQVLPADADFRISATFKAAEPTILSSDGVSGSTSALAALGVFASKAPAAGEAFALYALRGDGSGRSYTKKKDGTNGAGSPSIETAWGKALDVFYTVTLTRIGGVYKATVGKADGDVVIPNDAYTSGISAGNIQDGLKTGPVFLGMSFVGITATVRSLKIETLVPGSSGAAVAEVLYDSAR